MALTHGFGASIYYVAESSYGSTVSSPTYLRFGNIVESVKIKKSRSKEGFRSIDAVTVSDFLSKTNKVDLEITYVIQRPAPFDTMLTRTSGALPSYQIELTVNSAVSASDAYYTLNGCKVGTVKVSAKLDEYVKATVTFMGATITKATSQPTATSREGALNTSTYPYGTFSGASVTNAAATWEAGCTGIELVADNGLEPLAALGSANIANMAQGAFSIKGTADVYIEEGGGTHLTAVESDSGVSIILNCGASGALKLTVAGAEFSDFEIDVNNKDPVIKRSIPFEGTTLTVSTV